MGLQLVPGVPAGLHQLLHNVRQSGGAGAAALGQNLIADGLRLIFQSGDGPGFYIGQSVAALGQKGLGGLIALRVDPGVV